MASITPGRPSQKGGFLLLIGAAALLALRFIAQSLRAPTSAHANDSRLPVYDFPPTFAAEPPHLTPIDPATLIPKGTRSIDYAHRHGLLHTGSILYVMDSSGSLLFLQRSQKMVTCPSTWSILGEHSTAGEGVIEGVVRGIEEELGFASSAPMKSDTPGAWTVELHPIQSPKESLHVTIQNATEYPLYYIRHYGPRNNNRIDRQLTFTWIVKFPKRHDEIPWQVDDEVANHRWLDLAEVRAWYAEDGKRYNKAFESDGDVTDDGPDVGDFCHETVRLLYEAGLSSIA
ncbi:hypothetical protein ACHAXT_011882 [Thalassiosira profunda]